jgi:uncharacterized membrane protein
MAQQQPTSFARIIVTPIILLIAGYLIGGLIPGVAIAAVVGIAYIIWASSRGRAPKVSKRDETMKTLSDLANLRAQGAISNDEYEAKKAELLRQI